MKNLHKVIGKLERTRSRIEGKIEKLKTKHAHALMNEARMLLGKTPRKFGGARKPKVKRASKINHGPTFGGKKVNGK